MHGLAYVLPSLLESELLQRMTQHSESPASIVSIREVGGGSISRCLIIQTETAHWFVKLNRADQLAMFAAEADGLDALAACPFIGVPRVIGHGSVDAHAFLILERLKLRTLDARPENNHAAIDAGRALAQLHRIGHQQPGWHQSNFIGSTVQKNRWSGSWAQFFGEQRLQFQLRLAKDKGYDGKLQRDGEKLLGRLPLLFASHRPAISLLHGDLWHGNEALDETGKLTLYDPAVYFGDRETDLAMAQLFGGFPASFYAGYNEAWPLDEGYARRKPLYQLYHILNHLNLFGGGYLHQAERMLQSLLVENER